MHRASTVSQTSIRLRGKPVPGAEDRQRKIAGFDQELFSKSSILCIGAGGLISHIAPTLVRKGIGRITLLDDDVVEASNLNRQRFYIKDIGRNKALALAENLERECIATTEIRGIGFRLEEAIARQIDLGCNAVVCGVDNNPARVAASRHFRFKGIPVIFTGVSRDGDCGYVFVQESHGPCIGCLYPDMADDDHYPCPGTPAIADILQAAISTYLAFALSKMADRGSTICTWGIQRESVQHTFARQAIPMTWDFVEINPFLTGTGTLEGSVAWTAESLDCTPALVQMKGVATQLDARNAGQPGYVYSTDPPYYDNIGYADLSDFFYVWLRHSIGSLYPDLFSTLLTPKVQELVATPYRFEGSEERAALISRTASARLSQAFEMRTIPSTHSLSTTPSNKRSQRRFLAKTRLSLQQGGRRC
jgi:molybdopterin/thiamine biosynthesis adenylyltransferase